MWAGRVDGFRFRNLKSAIRNRLGAGWSSPVARWAHNPKVAGSNPAPATNLSRLRNAECGFRISHPQSEIRSPKSSRGRSSAGRAPRLQRGGQGFESPRLHQTAADLRIELTL